MISILVLSMLAAVATMPADSVSLTQLAPNQIDGGLASVGLNRGYRTSWSPARAKPMRIGDRAFEHGLGTRANNVITYRIDGRYRRFQGWVGLDAGVLDKSEASVIFKVLGDGRVLFESGVMRPSDIAKKVDVSVEGVKELKLVAEDAGDGKKWDHADWADPVLVGILPRVKFSDGKTAYQVRGNGLVVGLDARGYPTVLKLSKSGAEYPVDGGSELEGCAVTDTRVEKTAQGVRIDRTLSCEARMSETFEPAGEGVRWELDIQSEGQARGGHVNTRLRWLEPKSYQIWTAWGRGPKWSDPMPSWAFNTHWYEYGTFFNRSYGVSLPMFTVLDQKHDAAVTLLQNFEDKIIKMNLGSDADGTLEFSRYDLRLGEGRNWKFRVDLIPHAADVRAALGAVVARHPEFFDPPNPLADQVGGHAAYSFREEDLGPTYHDMGFTFNWKASFDFPYMGMFLPPVRPGETWTNFPDDSEGRKDRIRNRPTSVEGLADYSARMRREGYYVLSYFNVTEFGTDIKFPAPPRKAVKDEDLWHDSNDYLYSVLPDSILLNPEPIYTWGDAVVTDCGDPAYKRFLLDQARRHVEEIPEASGICIDRMDWLDYNNPRADDGLSWNKGPVRSLLNSWQDLMTEMGPIFHKANKIIFGNPMVRRPDLSRYLDGFYDEHGDFGFSTNTTSFLALRKPAAMWTRDDNTLKPDPDAFMQHNLYMGVFLTAPIPDNDHCLLPSPLADKIYMEYGPMFNALRGRKWVLAPHVIETEKPALANVFEVPSGYVVVVALAGARPSIPVTLRNLKLEGWRAEAMVPGEKAWKPVPVTFSRNDAQMKVSLKRGVAVVRLVRP